MMEELRAIVGPHERIFYAGRPDKKCFIFESIFNPLLVVAVIFAIFDFGVIGGMYSMADSAGAPNEITSFLVPFMLLHLMPVWIYLGGVLFTVRKYKNTAYIVTDRAIYVSGGTFTRNINAKPFAELSYINLHRGFFDQIFHVGDIIATTNQFKQNGKAAVISIASISDYIEVYNLVKKLQTDIYSDVMYPNAKRPAENPGYHTKYRGL